MNYSKIVTRLVIACIFFMLASAQLLADQCTATTKKGAQCKRKAIAGSIYCAQHEKMYGVKSDGAPAKEKSSKKSSASKAKSLKPAEQKQCRAMTKDGKQCSRKAMAGSDYCKQHSKKAG